MTERMGEWLLEWRLTAAAAGEPRPREFLLTAKDRKSRRVVKSAVLPAVPDGAALLAFVRSQDGFAPGVDAGLPATIYGDRGREFSSRDFVTGCAALGITVRYPPPSAVAARS